MKKNLAAPRARSSTTQLTTIKTSSFQDIAKAIEANDKIVIHTHVNPDGDCNGSALGLRQLIKDNFGKKKIYVTGKECPDNLEFLGKYDPVSEKFIKEALNIAVDVSSSNRVSDQRFVTGKQIIKMDHHLDSESFGHINVVETLPSCAEIIAIMAHVLGWKISKEAALPLLTGMITDTGRFRHLRHRPQTLLVASHLASTGINLEQDIYRHLYVRDRKSFAFTSWYLGAVKFSGKFAYSIITEKEIKKYGVSLRDAASWLSNMRDLKGIEVWAQFTQYPDFWRCEYRSSGYPVNEVAKHFGGGGHKQASGSRAASLIEVNRIISYVKRLKI